MNILTILGIIFLCIGAVGGILLAIGQWQGTASDKKDIIESGNKNKEEIVNRIDSNEEFKKILVTPNKILLPANSSRDLPVVVTNNYPYPVFMVVLEIKVKGNIDLTKDFEIMPMGSGIWQAKYYTIQIPQINGGQAINLAMKLNGANYHDASELDLAVVHYLKDPTPNFTLHNVHGLPKTIKVPDGFMPPGFENK